MIYVGKFGLRPQLSGTIAGIWVDRNLKLIRVMRLDRQLIRRDRLTLAPAQPLEPALELALGLGWRPALAHLVPVLTVSSMGWLASLQL